jgi:hypothetical protein
MAPSESPRIRDSSTNKISKKRLPPSSSHRTTTKSKVVFTSTKQVMNYVTIKGVESDTSYVESKWPIFCLKEQMDNSYDFYTENYPNSPKSDRMIAVRVWADKHEQIKCGLIHIRVRNLNVNNIAVFTNLEATFDFNQWYSSKRDQHKGTCGSLGDFLKRSLGMGYASMSQIIDDVGVGGHDSFEDNNKQWDHPLILRFNGKEYRVFIRVDEFSENPIRNDIKGPFECLIPEGCIETEVTLPRQIIPNEEGVWHRDRNNLYLKLFEYYKRYKIAKSRIHFEFDGKGLYDNDNVGSDFE